MRVRRGKEQSFKRVEPSEVQEEQSLHIYRPNAYRELVRQGMQSEGQKMARNRHGEVVKIMSGSERVRDNGLHRCLTEYEGI